MLRFRTVRERALVIALTLLLVATFWAVMLGVGGAFRRQLPGRERMTEDITFFRSLRNTDEMGHSLLFFAEDAPAPGIWLTLRDDGSLTYTTGQMESEEREIDLLSRHGTVAWWTPQAPRGRRRVVANLSTWSSGQVADLIAAVFSNEYRIVNTDVIADQLWGIPRMPNKASEATSGSAPGAPPEAPQG